MIIEFQTEYSLNDVDKHCLKMYLLFAMTKALEDIDHARTGMDERIEFESHESNKEDE